MNVLIGLFSLFFYARLTAGLQLSTKKPSASSRETSIFVSPRRSFLSSTLTSSAAAAATAVILNKQVAWGEDQDYSVAPEVTNVPDSDGFITTETGLRYKIIKDGTGAVPISGQTVKAHYTGWLDGFDGDKKFDSSRYVFMLFEFLKLF